MGVANLIILKWTNSLQLPVRAELLLALLQLTQLEDICKMKLSCIDFVCFMLGIILVFRVLKRMNVK